MRWISRVREKKAEGVFFKDEEELQDIMDDTLEKCEKDFGKVYRCKEDADLSCVAGCDYDCSGSKACGCRPFSP